MALLRDPSSAPTPDWLLDDLVARAPGGPTAKLLAQLPDLVAHFLIGRLGEVTTPVELLWGASDRLMTLDYAEALRAQLPAARLTPVERCGHTPQLECAERFRAALAALLAGPPPIALSPPAEVPR
jgi:pimeloyl-ACP methyl ester carboxylesterase